MLGIVSSKVVYAQTTNNEILLKELQLKKEKSGEDKFKTYSNPKDGQTFYTLLTDENNKIFWIEETSLDAEGWAQDGIYHYWINTVNNKIIAIDHYGEFTSDGVLTQIIVENGKILKYTKDFEGEMFNDEYWKDELNFIIPDFIYSKTVGFTCGDGVSANVREIPSTSAKVVMKIECAQCLFISKGDKKETIAGSSDYWYNIKCYNEDENTGNGKWIEGWVFGKFIEQPILDPPSK